MIEFLNDLDHPCLLFTITRIDGEIERVTTASTDITIDSITWTKHPGLVAGVKTSRIDGTPPTIGFQAQLQLTAPLRFTDFVHGKFDGARVQVHATNQSVPMAPDLVFDGLAMGEVIYTQHGIASFDLISIFAPPRISRLVEQFTLKCRWEFGAHHTCRAKVFPNTTFPYIYTFWLTDPPARNMAFALGYPQRYRFGSADTPEDFLNVYLEATVNGGVTAGSAPAFSSTVGAFTTDGTQVWQTKNAYARAARIAGVDQHTVMLDRLPDPRAAGDSTWFCPMKFVFRSGEYSGRAFKGNGWNSDTLSFETYLPCPLASVGDWIEITPDCDKTHAMCFSKFANVHNFGGFPFQYGAKAQACTWIEL